MQGVEQTTMTHISMIHSKVSYFISLLVLLALVSAPAAMAGDTLQDQGYLLWQQINEARANPRAVMNRLNIPEDTVKNVLGADAWLLDQGLPPLAWSDQIGAAAQNHGRDMLDHLYYSHLSQDGRTPQQRLLAVGYEPLLEEETLAALIFNNPIALDMALQVMCDNIFRDELSGTPGVARNIFSPNFSEVGLALFAESIALLADQPNVYLLVVDFSQPVAERHFVIGHIDPGTSLLLYRPTTGEAEEVTVLPGDLFQLRLSGRGEELFYWETSTANYVYRATTRGLALGQNHTLNLRR